MSDLQDVDSAYGTHNPANNELVIIDDEANENV